MGLFLLTCYICDKKHLGRQSLFAAHHWNPQGHRDPLSSPNHMLLEQLELKILVLQGFCMPFDSLWTAISSPYFQGLHRPSVSMSRNIFFCLKIRDAYRKGAKYGAWSPESKIKIQTQYLLEHKDLSEAAWNAQIVPVAQTWNERSTWCRCSADELTQDRSSMLD